MAAESPDEPIKQQQGDSEDSALPVLEPPLSPKVLPDSPVEQDDGRPPEESAAPAQESSSLKAEEPAKPSRERSLSFSLPNSPQEDADNDDADESPKALSLSLSNPRSPPKDDGDDAPREPSVPRSPCSQRSRSRSMRKQTPKNSSALQEKKASNRGLSISHSPVRSARPTQAPPRERSRSRSCSPSARRHKKTSRRNLGGIPGHPPWMPPNMPMPAVWAPWQMEVVNVLERFADSSRDRFDLPPEFSVLGGGAQLALVKQLSPSYDAVVVQQDGHQSLRRIRSKVARVGPFGAIKLVVKAHGGRMPVWMCAQLIESTYEDERLMLQSCGLRLSWHQRWNLCQYQGEFRRVGIRFDKKFTWMAVKGKNPGPESSSESEDEETLQRPRHVVSIAADGGSSEGLVRTALRLSRKAVEADELRRAKRSRASNATASAPASSRKTAGEDTELHDSDAEDGNRAVYSDGLPWWGDAPGDECAPDKKKSNRALVTKRHLPAYEMRDVVNEAIDQFPVLVVVGATGCGKSTQLPIARHEWLKSRDPDAPSRVICCEPRRIAAVSLADRVSLECGKAPGALVGYKVRFETKASEETQVLYCTTGVLLRAMMRNPTLEGVSCVFIDEVHERDVLADFTLLLLRDLMQSTRKDLKLVVMSATVDPSWCLKYFPDCHALDLPGDTPYSVSWHWLEDCLELTGHTPKVDTQAAEGHGYDPRSIQEALAELPSDHKNKFKAIYDVICAPNDWIDSELIIKMVEHIDNREDPVLVDALEESSSKARGAILIFLPGMAEIRLLVNRLRGCRCARQWHVLPLHSTLSHQEQQRVFDKPPAGTRKIIVSTNIAESSVTIDDVVYVIDSGRERLVGLNPETNVSSLMTQWIARANANQRKGRAGRCRAGSYFALFSQVQYDKLFLDSHPPEMQRTQVENLCLQAKAFGFEDVEETLGRAPAPPDKRTIDSAVSALVAMGAFEEDGSLTRLGRLLIALPIHPQLGKLLLYARLFECTDAALTVAACADVGRIFTGGQRGLSDRVRMDLSGGFLSDHWVCVQAYRRYRQLAEKPEEQKKLADILCLNTKSMDQVHKIREDLLLSLQELQRGPGRLPVERPPSFRTKADDVRDEFAALSAALAASLNLARLTPLFDFVCLSSPPCVAATAPSSVNTRKNIMEPRLFRECLAMWFSRLQTSELFVDDCTFVRAVHVLLLGPPLEMAQEMHSGRSRDSEHVRLRLRPQTAKSDDKRTGSSNGDGAEVENDEFDCSREERQRKQQEEDKNEERILVEIKKEVRHLYEEHNPAKLDEVEHLFEKYAGVEREMYQRICKKYGVEPKEEFLHLEEGEEDNARLPGEQDGRLARKLRHIERHTPWLRCASPEMLRLFLDLRRSAGCLLDRCAGRPWGALRPEAKEAVRAVRRVLLELGKLGELEHKPKEDKSKDQLPAPLEEPWIREKRRGASSKGPGGGGGGGYGGAVGKGPSGGRNVDGKGGDSHAAENGWSHYGDAWKGGKGGWSPQQEAYGAGCGWGAYGWAPTDDWWSADVDDGNEEGLQEEEDTRANRDSGGGQRPAPKQLRPTPKRSRPMPKQMRPTSKQLPRPQPQAVAWPQARGSAAAVAAPEAWEINDSCAPGAAPMWPGAAGAWAPPQHWQHPARSRARW